MIPARDVRLAIRRLMAAPAAAGAVVVAIALAIAVSSALFAVLDGLQFRDLPFERPEELVAVDYKPVSGMPPPLAYRQDLAAERDALRHRLETSRLVAGAAQVGFSSFFGRDAAAAGIEATGVDARFFRLLGLPPVLGRTLDTAEERSPAALSRDALTPLPVVIGYDLWQRVFGGAADVLDQPRELGGRQVRVVGVMAPGVKFPVETSVWAPVWSGRGRPPAIVRLAPGVHLDTLAGAFPQLTFTPLRETVRPGDARSVVLLFGASTLLVLVAWVQVAGLVSAGTVARLHDHAVHLALGASRSRLLVQFWIEGAVMLTAALALAAVATGPITSFVVDLLPASLRYGQYLAPGPKTLVYAAAVSALGLMTLGLVPLSVVRRATPASLLAGRLGDSPLRPTRVRQAFFVGQMALTAWLLYVATLVVHSQLRVAAFDHGFDTAHVLAFRPPATVRHGITRSETRADVEDRQRLVAESVERLNASPAVRAAADVEAVLLTGLGTPPEATVQQFGGRPVHPEVRVRLTGAGAGFVDALGATLVAGHRFDDPLHQGRVDLAIVNETLANVLAPVSDLLGVEVREPVMGTRVKTAWFEGEIVGVVQDLVDSSPASPARPQMFVSSAHPNFGPDTITINARPPLESTVPVIRSILEDVWGATPPGRFGFMRDEIDRIHAPFQARSTLLGLIAVLYLPLAVVGLTGALADSIRSRERETAIRTALGAGPAAARRVVVRSALMMIAAGVAIGVVLGSLSSRLLAHQLFGVRPVDPLTIGIVAGALIGLGWTVAHLASRRAARLHPALVLRRG